MNSKDFMARLAQTSGHTPAEVEEMVLRLLEAMSRQWVEGNEVSIRGFGSFWVRKRMERIEVNPVSGQRMLVPPELVLVFSPDAQLEEKSEPV